VCFRGIIFLGRLGFFCVLACLSFCREFFSGLGILGFGGEGGGCFAWMGL